MTPADTLLERLSSWNPSADPGRHSLTAKLPDGRTEVTITADRVDPTGAAVRDISVTRTAPSPDPEPLAARAARVAGTARGLSENLRVLEIDTTRDEAVLRSDAPAVKPDGTRYYEVVLTPDRATVKRYHAAPGAKREAVAFPLTHESIANLAGALAE